jgi:hypothetical protein
VEDGGELGVDFFGLHVGRLYRRGKDGGLTPIDTD